MIWALFNLPFCVISAMPLTCSDVGKDHLPLGFTTAKDPRYILRPEAIESVFIMYRVTGKRVWQDLGWRMFTAIANGTKTEHGTHAAVQDVTRAAKALPQEDYMEVSIMRWCLS